MRIEKKLETKEVEVITYIAEDGTCFEYERECKSYEYELRKNEEKRVSEETFFKEIDILEGLYIYVMRARNEDDISKMTSNNYYLLSELTYPALVVLIDVEGHSDKTCTNVFSLEDFVSGQNKAMRYISDKDFD